MSKKIKKSIYLKLFTLLSKYKKYMRGILICLILTSGITFMQPLIIRQITDIGMTGKNMKVIIIYSILLLIIGSIGQIFRLMLSKSFVNFHNNFQFDLLKKSFEKFTRLPISYFEQKNSNEIINTVHSDISAVSNIIDTVSSFSLLFIMQMFGGIIGLFLINWKMTILILAFIPIRYMIVNILSKKKNENFKKFLEYRRVSSSWLGDQVAGIREYKLWNLFSVKINQYSDIENKVLHAYKNNIMIDQYNTLFEQFIDIFITFIVYIISGYLIIQNEFTIGSAFAFITYSAYVAAPINFLVNIKYHFSEIKPSAERLFSFFDEKEENTLFGSKKLNKTNKENCAIIDCKNISFSYKEGKDILKNLSLTIFENEKIGILGDNGSGKTTLLNIISGLTKPERGEVYIKGTPYSELSVEEIRKNITIMSQKSHLFQTSIKENIDLRISASLDEIKRVAGNCGADDFIQKLENGYEYNVGVDGSNLSGGERQKVTMARSLLKPGLLWIFDEPTTNFDVKSEKLWLELIRGLNKKTIIIISHKYQELENMNRIFVLKDGELKEVLDREELIKTSKNRFLYD